MRWTFGRVVWGLWLMAAAASAGAAVVVYPAPEGYEPNPRFRVTLSGKPAHVYTARVAAEQNWVAWPAPMQSHPVGFCCFDMDGPVEVRVEVSGTLPRSARVRPLSKGVAAHLVGRVVTLRLDRPGNYVLELNEDVFDHLYLFANPPEKNPPRPGDPRVRYFGPGVHSPADITSLRDGETVYLAGGAVVKGLIWAEGVSGIRIAGRGILEGTEVRGRRNLIRCTGCRDVVIEDIILLDSPSWAIRLEECQGVTLRNVRQISYRQNSDGIDPYSSEDVTVENVFIRNYDDGVVVKAARNGPPARRIRTRGSTFITDHGTSLKVGLNETLGPPIRDVLFQDCDVLSCRGRPLGVMLNGPSCISDVRFEDIRVEESRVNPSVAREAGRDVPCFIVCFVEKGNKYLSNYTPGCIRQVLFRDVTYLGRPGATFPEIRMAGWSEASSVAEVTLENVRVLHTVVTDAAHPSLG
ncbi:MAG: glycosyl hydrolase family 28 protein, partial [Armatimonadota bacterium]|nr:glycosyl hydrolase family 28 protein [Armatimonadota bacterium]